MQHLSYITENHEALLKRPFALLEDEYIADFVEEPIIEIPTQTIASKNVTNDSQPIKQITIGTTKQKDKPDTSSESTNLPTKVPEPGKLTTDTLVTDIKAVVNTGVESNQPPQNTPDAPPIIKESNIFSNSISSEYYFVINVSEASLNLNSSRFGIGQFNRANFAGDNLKHQLKNINDENQLIVIGAFENKSDLANYRNKILGLLKEIMKVPIEKYSYFLISKQNLDLLKDKTTINKYKTFEQNSFSE